MHTTWQIQGVDWRAKWRRTQRALRELHPVLRAGWYIIGPPLWFVSNVGYVLSLLFFPSAMLSLGFAFTGHEITPGWWVWTALVTAGWTLLWFTVATILVRRVRERIIDLSAFATLTLITLAYGIACFYVAVQPTA